MLVFMQQQKIWGQIYHRKKYIKEKAIFQIKSYFHVPFNDLILYDIMKNFPLHNVRILPNQINVLDIIQLKPSNPEVLQSQLLSVMQNVINNYLSLYCQFVMRADARRCKVFLDGRVNSMPGINNFYTSKSYFLWQLPYENTIQNACKGVRALSNWGKNSPPQLFNGKSIITHKIK